jgi:ABC-type glycerol-3-phosphate transport system substrate-binding protein
MPGVDVVQEPRPVVRIAQDERFAPRKEALDAFTEQTGIEVALDLLPADRLSRVARHAFGARPDWDLLVPDEVIVAEQIHRGLLEPLGRRAHRAGMDLDDFPQAAIDRFRASDVIYAIPFAAMSNVLIHRADILERYGYPVPATFEDLRATALGVQMALRRDGVEDVVGFTSRGIGGYGQNFWILGSTLFPSWGWNWNRGSGQPPRVHEPATAAALGFYAALLREAGPPDAARMTGADARRQFVEGKAVFLLDIATEVATMRQADPEGIGVVAEIALVPTGPSGRPEPGLASPAFCIPASSAVKEEAWKLLQLLLSPEELLKDAIELRRPETARQSVFDSEAYAATFDESIRATLAETRRYARINRPLIPFGFDLGEIAGAAAEAVIAGEQTADEALRDAQELIDGMRWSMAPGNLLFPSA